MQKHLKRYRTIMACAALLASLCGLSQVQEASPSRLADPRRADTGNLLKENNSLGSVLFQLASERFTVNEKKHDRWIMTLHDATRSFDVIQYSDGRTKIVALPVMDPGDEYGLRRYVDHYNRLNVKAADLKVKAGQYREAEELYRLLLHHDPRSSLADGVRERLRYLEKMKAGEDTEGNLNRFMKLYTDVAPGFLVGIEDAKPTVVSNLFQVNVHEE